MERSQARDLLEWIRDETERRGVSPRELLDYLRQQARTQIMGRPETES